jgi:CHAD domain-containing protein
MSQLKDYTDKQLQNALHLLKQYDSASNEEVLHQLRVSLKKIKAVIDYLLTRHPKKVKSIRRKLQIVFHPAGDLREAELRLKWLKGNTFNFLIAETQFEQKINEELELFFTQKEIYRKLLATVDEKLNRYLKETEESDLLHYALELKQKLGQLLPVVLQQDWHALRKLIKQLLYAHHWLSAKDKLKVLTVAAYQKMDQLQEKIGAWHDVVDLLEWLMDEQLFLNKEKAVKQQFNKAFALVQKEIDVTEKAVLKQLREIKKPVNKK